MICILSFQPHFYELKGTEVSLIIAHSPGQNLTVTMKVLSLQGQ